MSEQGSSTSQAGGFPFALSTVFVLVLVNAVNIIDRNMFGLLLPDIKRDIHLTDTELGLLGGPAFALTYALSGVPIAWLADRIGRRNIIVVGLTFWSAATAATGLAANAIQLFIARIALGLGEATNTAPASALIGDWFPTKSRTVAVAFFTTGGPLGIMIGFPAIGWIAQNYGWQSAFFAMGLVGVLIAGLLLLLGREPSQISGPISRPKVEEKPKLKPALRQLFGSRAFVIMLLAGVAFSIANTIMNLWVPAFLERVRGLNTEETGAFIGIYRGFFGVIAAILGGYVIAHLTGRDRRWLGWVPAALCLAMAPAELLFIWSGSDLGWQAGLAIDTLLFSIVTPCSFALVLAIVDPRIRAFGTSIYLLVFSLVGQSFGSLAVGMLNDSLHQNLGEEAIRYSMMLAPAGMAVSGLFLFLLARELPHLAEEVSANEK